MVGWRLLIGQLPVVLAVAQALPTTHHSRQHRQSVVVVAAVVAVVVVASLCGAVLSVAPRAAGILRSRCDAVHSRGSCWRGPAAVKKPPSEVCFCLCECECVCECL